MGRNSLVLRFAIPAEPIEQGEAWAYTFGKRAPDFVLMIRGQTIGRVYHCEVRHGGPR